MSVLYWAHLYIKCSLGISNFLEEISRADCGSKHEILIAKFRIKLKKVGKTSRPFRNDLNQIPYDYTVEVRNRCKGLAWWAMNGGLWHCTGDRNQDHLQEKEMQKSKIAVWGGLTNSCEKKRNERQREKERYTHLNAEFQRIARRDKKAFFSDQCKEIEENTRKEKTRDLFKNIRDTTGIFHAKMGSIKDRNGMDLTEEEDIKKRWQD